MNPPFWVVEEAEAFWRLAGGEEPFPRALRRPIADALPLAIVQLPRLRLRETASWLGERGVVCNLDIGDRPLQAALVARYGQGILFVDGGDPDDEQRFSLAHELAHFLRHYRRQRRRVEEQLGPTALEVLDGDRPASRTERIHALLADVSIGYYVHLMRRASDGSIADSAVATAEREADRLAYQLLAPAELVLGSAASSPGRGQRHAVIATLQGRFGLPERPATDYASLLIPSSRPRGDFGFLTVIK